MKTLVTRGWTERPRGALLEPVIELWPTMYRIGGRLRTRAARSGGAAGGIPPLVCWSSNLGPLSGSGTVAGGQFDWGGRLLKGNGGAQRSPQRGWKSRVECKGIRGLDCETDGSSRGESRA